MKVSYRKVQRNIKGKTVVIINTEEYTEKVHNFLKGNKQLHLVGYVKEFICNDARSHEYKKKH